MQRYRARGAPFPLHKAPRMPLILGIRRSRSQRKCHFRRFFPVYSKNCPKMHTQVGCICCFFTSLESSYFHSKWGKKLILQSPHCQNQQKCWLQLGLTAKILRKNVLLPGLEAHLHQRMFEKHRLCPLMPLDLFQQKNAPGVDPPWRVSSS